MAEIRILYDFYKAALKSGGWARGLNMLGGGLSATQILLYTSHNTHQGKLLLINTAFVCSAFVSTHRTRRVADWYERHRALSPNDNYAHLIEDVSVSIRIKGVAGFFYGDAAACAAHQAMAFLYNRENLDWKVMVVGAACVAVGLGFGKAAKNLCDKYEPMSRDSKHNGTRFFLAPKNPRSPS